MTGNCHKEITEYPIFYPPNLVIHLGILLRFRVFKEKHAVSVSGDVGIHTSESNQPSCDVKEVALQKFLVISVLNDGKHHVGDNDARIR